MEYPKDLRYTKTHEWLKKNGKTVRVGISGFAVEQLGDITMVEPPEVETTIEAGDTCGTIESVKSVSDLYAPLSGTVTAINEELEDSPELVNESPYDAGWLFEMEPEDISELDDMLDAEDYEKLVAEEQAD
jgi:glycine cleavage system H protein